MSIDRFISRYWFALTLTGLHTLLVAAWAWIELNDAWNDMNPTMLVMAALHVVDYPIHLVLAPLVNLAQNTGNYLASLLLVGGAFWFVVGSLISFAVRASLHYFASTRAASTRA